MCHAPAELYEIHHRGYIREGYQADLVLVNPNAEWEVTSQNILSKCAWSPLEGHRFTSKVEKTFVNGKLVYDSGRRDLQRRRAKIQTTIIFYGNNLQNTSTNRIH